MFLLPLMTSELLATWLYFRSYCDRWNAVWWGENNCLSHTETSWHVAVHKPHRSKLQDGEARRYCVQRTQSFAFSPAPSNSSPVEVLWRSAKTSEMSGQEIKDSSKHQWSVCENRQFHASAGNRHLCWNILFIMHTYFPFEHYDAILLRPRVGPTFNLVARTFTPLLRSLKSSACWIVSSNSIYLILRW